MLRVLSDGQGGMFRLAAVERADKAVRYPGRLPKTLQRRHCAVLVTATARIRISIRTLSHHGDRGPRPCLTEQ